MAPLSSDTGYDIETITTMNFSTHSACHIRPPNDLVPLLSLAERLAKRPVNKAKEVRLRT